MTIMGLPIPDGIGPDVRLSITTSHGEVLALDLITAAMFARFAPEGELLPFLYREPADPEDPERTMPLRRATLAIIKDEVIIAEKTSPQRPRVPEHRRGADCHSMHAHHHNTHVDQLPYCKWSCTLCMGDLVSPCIPSGF